MAKANWATASSKMAEVKAILAELSEDNAPYVVSIGTAKTPITEVIEKLGEYSTAMSTEVHFTNAGGVIPANTTSDTDTTAATTDSDTNLFG